MRIPAKFNRGAILFTVALIGVIVYLIITGAANAAAEPAIRKVCTDYIAAESSYYMLPLQFRVQRPAITAEETDAYIAEMTASISSFYPSDPASWQFIVGKLAYGIRNQAKGNNIITENTVTVSEYNSITFDGSLATVTVRFTRKASGPGIYTPSSGTSAAASKAQAVSKDQNGTIILRHTDGAWKVVYSGIGPPTANQRTVTPNGVVY